MVQCWHAPSDNFQKWVKQCSGIALDKQKKQYLVEYNIDYLLGQMVCALLAERPSEPAHYLAYYFTQASAGGVFGETPSTIEVAGQTLTAITATTQPGPLGRSSTQGSLLSSRDAPPRKQLDRRGTEESLLSFYSIPEAAVSKRLLVFTDAGEEIDDEAALWLLSTQVDMDANFNVDVVFTTGDPIQRAMRWASILGGSTKEKKRYQHRIRYMLGPESERHMRYKGRINDKELRRAGFSELRKSMFDGGSYDVILQISPLDGFSDNFSSPPPGTAGALSRINRRSSAQVPVYVTVGTEGSTNCPQDSLHKGFKKVLGQKGFIDVYVEARNYVTWHPFYFDTMPSQLVHLVLQDEWNKAVGRIPPSAATLFVRFRVNTHINYELVRRALAYYDSHYHATPHYAAAERWWQGVAAGVREAVMEGYVRRSRESDEASAGRGCVYGNPSISSPVRGMDVSWRSVMSAACVRDVLAAGVPTEAALDACTVDYVMGCAVVAITGMLLRIYAFDAYASGKEPNESQCHAYLGASLDFRAFPHLLGDVSDIQKEVLGSPMYDPSGMLIALVLLAANPSQVHETIKKLRGRTALLDPVSRTMAMKAAYEAEPLPQLVERFFPRTKKRLLVLTDGGEEADDEAALWLLATHLDTTTSIDADVVFMTGNPVQRAMRWARVLTSLGRGPKPGANYIHYFVGPETDRPMRQHITFDGAEMRAAGLGELRRSYFEGGAYDVVLQIAPLGGFVSNSSSCPDDVRGSLGRIAPRAGAELPLFVVVGIEGSDNFPSDPLHEGFKAMLVQKGFTAVHVERRNYTYWSQACLDCMPPRLTELALQDEWSKTISRIPPSRSTLLVRFRMNALVKYDVASRVYAAFESRYCDLPDFQLACGWWDTVRGDVARAVSAHYVGSSREADDLDRDHGFGDPRVCDRVRGRDFTWRSLVSPGLARRLLAGGVDLDSPDGGLSVDGVMGAAVTAMTGMLLTIYAFAAFAEKSTPSWAQVELYLTGTGRTPPLDFQTFPNIFHDLSVVKRAAVGSKMSDTSGMLVALLLLSASAEQARVVVDKLEEPAMLLPPEELSLALVSALEGDEPEDLVQSFFTLMYC